MHFLDRPAHIDFVTDSEDLQAKTIDSSSLEGIWYFVGLNSWRILENLPLV